MKHGKFERVNILDKTIFKLLYHILELSPTKKLNTYYLNTRTIKNILVIRTGGIGDVLLTLPFFRTIKQEFPNVNIDIICMKRNINMVRIIDREIKFKNIYLIDKDFLAYILNKYDVIFNLDQSKYDYITPVLVKLLNGESKIGYDIKNRAIFYTHKVVYLHQEYETQSILNQLKYFKINKKIKEDDLIIKNKRFFHSKNRLQKLYNIKNDYIIISIGGLNPQNKLPNNVLIDVLNSIANKYNVVFIGSKQDKIDVCKIIKSMERDIFINLCGETSLVESLSLLKNANLFIGYDGGPLHMAVSVGCKTLSIWGPSLFQKWSPKNKEKNVFVKTFLPCQPCIYGRFPNFEKCPYNQKCLKDLKTEDIISKLKIQSIKT